jgi:hypothetical protein
MMLVSVHVPKTGGVTFGEILRRSLGGRVAFDYRRPPWMPTVHSSRKRKAINAIVNSIPDRLYHRATMCQLNGKLMLRGARVVHGHFRADRFDGRYPDLRYCIWLRDPADLAASWYHFGRKYPSRMHIQFNRLQRRLSEEYRFICAATSLPIDIQTTMVGDKRIEDFDFVGLWEERDEALRLFGRIFGVDLPGSAFDVSLNASRSRSELGRPHPMPDAVREELHRLHANDVVLYRQARCHYQRLKAKYL